MCIANGGTWNIHSTDRDVRVHAARERQTMMCPSQSHHAAEPSHQRPPQFASRHHHHHHHHHHPRKSTRTSVLSFPIDWNMTKRGDFLVVWLILGCTVERCCVGFQISSKLARRNLLLQSSSALLLATKVNGDTSPEFPLEMNITEGVNETEMMPLAPPLTYDKFITMQEKRVVATIRYTGDSGLKPYYLTVAKKLKASHPDILIEKRILPALPSDGPVSDLVFEILIDGKVVVGTKRTRKPKSGAGVDDITGGKSVYISMQELDLAISKARRRRRPSTLYGESGSESFGLESLRKSNDARMDNGWND